MIPVAARGDIPPPAAPRNMIAASMAGLIFISTASVIPKTIIIAVVGIVPGPSADSTVAKRYMTTGMRYVRFPARTVIFFVRSFSVSFHSASPNR